MSRLAALPLVLLALLAPACRSGSLAEPSADYVLVYLRSGGAAAEKTPEERQVIQAAHLENIGRLAREGKIVVAGPFGQPMPDPALRGLFVFDVADVHEAEELTRTDRAIQEGVLTMDAHPFRSSPDLRELPARYFEREAAREGRAADPDIRPYVILRAADAERAEKALAGAGGVVLAGRLGGELAGRALFVLDDESPDEAAARLAPVSDEIGEHELLPWWASPALAEPSDG